MTRPNGIDVSWYQGNVDWKQVAPKVAFAVTKVTEGSYTVDPMFVRNWSGIKSAGIEIRGAYHFGHVENDPIEDAVNFLTQLATVGGLHNGDFVALDLEDKHDAEPEVCSDWASKWMSYVRASLDLPRERVFLYTGAWWWNERTEGNPVNRYPLWVSGYVPEDKLKLPRGWTKWTIWQHTSSLLLDGINNRVDANVYNGTLQELKEQMGVIKRTEVKIPVNATAPFPGADKFGPGKKGDHILMMGAALVLHGYGKHYKSGPSREWGDADLEAVKAFQKATPGLQGDADGMPGPKTWKLLGLG